MLRYVLPMLLLVLIIVSFSSAESGPEGKKAPDFTLKDMAGKRVQLSKLLENGPVLLDFWATWCVPCKQALRHLAKIHETYKDDGFTLLAISMDNTRSVSKVRAYARSQKWEFPVPLDTDNEVFKRYQGIAPPHTVLIGKDGAIVKVWIGYQQGEEEQIEEEVRKLLYGETGASE